MSNVQHYPATVGRFDEARDRAVIDGLTRWVEDRYRADLLERSSKHVYVSTLPGPVIEQIDRLRDSPIIRALIAGRLPAHSVIAPMKHTDELYISNYNKDHGGDQGLFDKHYDGNLRFLSSSVVVRALIYLQSDATYKVEFHDSRVEKAFATYDFGLLDAARHYTASKGANFETYAGIRIRGAMLDEVRKCDWTPRSVHRGAREIAEVIRKIENETGNEAKPADIAGALGMRPNGNKEIVLNFITPHQKWGIHSTYTDNLLMLTLSRGGPCIWISEGDAARAGIVDNDGVEAFTSNGALVARAVVSQRVKEGMVMMYHAQEKIVNMPGSEMTGNRGGINNSVTRIVLNPTHMIGGYAQFAYDFNYYGTIGTNRDEFVVIRKMKTIDWLDRPHADAATSSHSTAQAAE